VGFLVTVAAGPVVTVGKPERFLRRLFQAAVEIIKKKSPKASFVDFHSCGSFHRLFFFFFDSFFFFFLNEFSLGGKPGRIALRIVRPTASTVTGDFRTRSAWERAATYAQMMSFEDSTIRFMDTLFW
jgi:hypothetical protein